jgi:glucose-6-phosphate dehydrogenase assembly protein OpcA
MSELFAALPGQEVPVGGITAGFARLWANTKAQDQMATQLNLVLHLGLATTPADAVEQFQVAGRFARRYPCRVVVLCPLHEDHGPVELRAKIYGECFLGKSKDDTRCVEFVALSYPPAAHVFLQNEVSVCLSTDLPLYYWAHRFTSSRRLSAYRYLLTRAQRVLFDSAIVARDALSFPWPNQAAVRDLAYTRTRPLRQNLGQFLSRYAPGLITEGLTAVTLRHRAEFHAEADCLLGWLRKGLDRCGAVPDAIAYAVTAEKCPGCLSVEFAYAGTKKSFRWVADLAKNHSVFTGDLGTGRSTLTAGARLLEPEAALAEAMFS